MWLFSAAASLFVAAPVALTATWQVPRGTKISRNILLKSIFRLFREIYSSERKIVIQAVMFNRKFPNPPSHEAWKISLPGNSLPGNSSWESPPGKLESPKTLC